MMLKVIKVARKIYIKISLPEKILGHRRGFLIMPENLNNYYFSKIQPIMVYIVVIIHFTINVQQTNVASRCRFYTRIRDTYYYNIRAENHLKLKFMTYMPPRNPEQKSTSNGRDTGTRNACVIRLQSNFCYYDGGEYTYRYTAKRKTGKLPFYYYNNNTLVQCAYIKIF